MEQPEALQALEAQKNAYHQAAQKLKEEGEKLREVVLRSADALAPCHVGDIVRVADQGPLYEIRDVQVAFENNLPDHSYFRCYGKDLETGVVWQINGHLSVVQKAVDAPLKIAGGDTV